MQRGTVAQFAVRVTCMHKVNQQSFTPEKMNIVIKISIFLTSWNGRYDKGIAVEECRWLGWYIPAEILEQKLLFLCQFLSTSHFSSAAAVERELNVSNSDVDGAHPKLTWGNLARGWSIWKGKKEKIIISKYLNNLCKLID